MQCLRDSDPLVKNEGVTCVASFLDHNSGNDDVVNALRDSAPHLLQVVAESTESCDDDTALKCLIDLADKVPQYLRPQLDNIVVFCLKIASSSEADDNWKHMSLEVVITLAESASAMFRKLCARHIPALISRLLEMMCDVEEEADWAFRDTAENEEQDQDSNPFFGETSLDRLAIGLGGRALISTLLESWQAMLADSRWQARHAALMSISACGEGCRKQMEPILDQLIVAIMPFLQDSHPRVRYAACNALGQMSTDFGPVFQKKFHDKVIPGLLAVMDDAAHPRVQAHAGAALVNFSEECPPSIMSPYLDMIISKLESVLQAKFQELMERGNKLVLEQVVTTLAAVADSAEEKFAAYYDRFMPCLKYILQNATAPQLRLLRGKTIECVSLIGLAVGKEKFAPDCGEVMQVLLQAQNSTPEASADQSAANELAVDDPQLAYMISAWARMCRILGKDFGPYLPVVMPSLLRIAAMKPDVAILNQDEAKDLLSDDDWQVVNLGDQQNVGIKTTGLEEKAQACNMLVCYARELGDGFVDYVERVARIMVQHLKFYFHEGVRTAAAEALPCLLESAQTRGQEMATALWQFAAQPLLAAIDCEMELSVLAIQLGSLAECIEIMGRGSLTHEQLGTLSALLGKIVDEHIERQLDRQQQRNAEDYDEAVEENLQEEDEDDIHVLSRVSDVIHSLFYVYGVDFLQYFDQLAQKFAQLLQPTQPWADRQWAICVFDDVVEYASPQSAGYLQLFGVRLVECIVDPQPEVRQAAAYGIGILARFGAEDANTMQLITNAVPLLIRCINEPNARQPEVVSATENCISAIMKIVRYKNYNVNELLPLWFSWLPIWDDQDECEGNYDYLCELVEGNNGVILGAENANLPRVVMIMADAFERESILPVGSTARRMVGLLTQLRSSAEALFNYCMQQLPPNQAQAVVNALQNPPQA